jgi:cytochrome d ubiquinol oxidase subunit II
MSAVAGVALVGLAAIALYAIFGGADFGGGVLDLFAFGRTRREQQDAIGHAIGPVWETNHVWLIFVIVLLFTCFPPAFASLSVGLYIPLTFVLVGIILRGAAFAFRSYLTGAERTAQLWGHVFGIASVIAPFFFGAGVGGLTVGRYDWTSPFALAIGVLAVALCAQIAAVFLTNETHGDLREVFHYRAMATTVLLAGVGALALGIAYLTQPATFALLTSTKAVPGIAVAMILGFVVLGTLAARWYAVARIAVAAEAVAVLAGWYLSQAPYVIPGELTYAQAAAPDVTLAAFLWIAVIGAVLLVPSLALLFAIFKGRPTADAPH